MDDKIEALTRPLVNEKCLLRNQAVGLHCEVKVNSVSEGIIFKIAFDKWFGFDSQKQCD